MRTLRLSMFLCGALVSLPVLAQEAPYVPPPVSNPQVAAESDIINDSSALDDGNVRYIEPIFGVVQPGTSYIEWAPPALLVEDVGLSPSDAAFWVGGYWDWYDDEWCWARGRWVVPPQVGYAWNAPYYENRGGRVVYVGGYWRSQNTPFSRPTSLPALARSNPNWKHGPRPMGANGTFVPAPPGSKPGIIVPAPMGTPPRVMASQPPLDKAGMTVRPAANGRYDVHAPAGVVRGGQRVDTRVASMPARTGEKGVRPAVAADTSKATMRAPAKAALPNLDPTRAAERTVEREPAPRAVAVSPKPADGPHPNVPREVPRTPAERGVTAMPQRETPLRGETAPRGSAPVERAPVERGQVERGPMGPVERGPVERGPVERGAPSERGAAEARPMPATEAHPVAPAAHAAPMGGGGEMHGAPAGGGGEAHH